MSPQQIIELYRPVIVEIATITSKGTGFYVKEFDLIVTSKHLVGKKAEVTIAGRFFQKQLAKVWYIDSRYDLAFLEPPKGVQLNEIILGQYDSVRDGDVIVTIGHPSGFIYSATQGVISKADRVRDGIHFIQINVEINPGSSGGPLVNKQGEVIGVNSIVEGGEMIGFALPVQYLLKGLTLYKPFRGESCARCHTCGGIVLYRNIIANKYCPYCGTEVELPELVSEDVKLTGISEVVEGILYHLKKDIELARIGENNWEVQEDDVKIKIKYNTENYFLVCDAYISELPQNHYVFSQLYQFLLQENSELISLSLACENQNVVLNSVIYDIDLTKEDGVKLFQSFFEKAALYQRILVERFGCPILLENE